MKVNKLISANQGDNWFERITNECAREYPIGMMSDIGDNDLVIDCGCNVGGFAQAWKGKFNKFIAIDASSYNIEQYQTHHHHPTLHKALWSKDGEIVKLKKFMHGDNDTNSGNFGVTETDLGGNGWISEDWEEVETVSLEKILKGIDEVGLLKIDIEGAEYEFLMNKDLSPIKWITMELHNFLGGVKQKQLMTWIENTHEEVFSDGDGNNTHFTKAWKRKI